MKLRPRRLGGPASHPFSDDEGEYVSIVQHHEDVVEHLDVIDPRIRTIASLANAVNSILVPPLYFCSRKPVINLVPPKAPGGTVSPHDCESLGSNVQGVRDGLDQHVEDVLNRKAVWKRTIQGIWAFLKTPIGFISGVYAFLVAFWGAAIFLFLVKWIDLHNEDKQGFWVEVCSQVECGLFSVTGIGMIPSRTVDTIRVFKIWRYHRRVRQLQGSVVLPTSSNLGPCGDPKDAGFLSEAELQDLRHQQEQFRKSQTWYRPYDTDTHKAFPNNMALWICLLNDGNSIFQVMLSSCMWALNRFNRPAWTTGTLIPASFLCGLVSAILIWYGGQQTRRTEQVEKRMRSALAIPRTESPTQDLQAFENRGAAAGHIAGEKHSTTSQKGEEQQANPASPH
ncbi:hypothetical protein HYDPIDRAFT_121420 [Hydnomerulius pinastri MD-312]|nr:hypothetical protein HYDPIDRAFT_121420 [Hydnomerulius pinastri MD-312]